MWKKYDVELKMTGRFAAALPRTPEEIKAMLENRMPLHAPANYTPIEELTKIVVTQVVPEEVEGVEPEAGPQFGWATFKHNDDGLYYEGRCIRGHLKDCANQVKDILKVKALKAKVANKVYVMTEVIPLGTKVIAGTEQRFIQVMTMQGPRSTIKYIDYLEKPVLRFQLNVLEDDVINFETLNAIFDYGCVHGLGQERSQGWGRYTYTITEVK